ncbi:MAG: hypothetical protein NC212_08980 [Staphylococcus sp.]|nr:hypothetical protein [Staphylococcus sp.]
MPQDTIIQGGKTKITPNELATSAAKFRTDLLKMAMLALGPALNFFTLRTGIRYGETVGQLSGSMEIGPHDPYRVDNDDIDIAGRTLYTYFGSAVKRFDPNTVIQSIYGSSITKGEGLKNVPIVVQVLSFLAAKIGKGFALHLFDAVRNEKGEKTVDLFDGIDTITEKEITAGKISTELGNLFEFSEAIDSTNAVDLLTAFCRAASDELLECEDGSDSKGSGLNLYVPRKIIYAYRDDYKATTGHSPIYDKFNQTVVEGFDNIRLVPFAGKAKSSFIQLSTKQNMLIGTDQMGGVEDITVEKHHEFLLSFIATMFFGTNYESISPERLLVGKLFSA